MHGGENRYGQVGSTINQGDHFTIGGIVYEPIPCQSIPCHIDAFDGEKVKAISCGFAHSMALTESSRVYSWGYNQIVNWDSTQC